MKVLLVIEKKMYIGRIRLLDHFRPVKMQMPLWRACSGFAGVDFAGYRRGHFRFWGQVCFSISRYSNRLGLNRGIWPETEMAF